MKLRYLNAAHTIASTLGHLSGDRYVHEALQRQALGKDADCSHYAFCLAAWALFIQDALEKDVLNDPKKDALKQVKTDNLDRAITDYLTIANGEQFAFFAHTSFIQTVKTYAADIQANGIKRAIESFLSAQD